MSGSSLRASNRVHHPVKSESCSNGISMQRRIVRVCPAKSPACASCSDEYGKRGREGRRDYDCMSLAKSSVPARD